MREEEGEEEGEKRGGGGEREEERGDFWTPSLSGTEETLRWGPLKGVDEDSNPRPPVGGLLGEVATLGGRTTGWSETFTRWRG